MELDTEAGQLLVWVGTIVVLLAIILSQMVRILREYERGVIFRLGKLLRAKGPGLIILIPFIDKMVRVDLRIITMNVPKQEVITHDNVPVTVDAITYFRVVDAEAAIVRIENYMEATSLFAQTTLRSVLGQAELDELLAEREKINVSIQEIVDRQTDAWGIKVTAVEVKDVVLPETMKRAMARQAETERDRRAKVINAQGEFQAATNLVEAGKMMEAQPIALQLRFLQTMTEISNESSTVAFMPIPLELFRAFLPSGSGGGTSKTEA
jgi:regulator of protease activity HflC (stomatin/prohibitin superfamily)